MTKPRIIIFGASKGGERFLRRCGDRYRVLAFCDNDPRKQGTRLADFDVLPPSRLHEFPYDQIVVASMFGSEIKAQLVQHGFAPEERIRFAPKSALSPNKTYRPFEDDATRAFALAMLEFLDDALREADIPFYLDHGTLLGVVRDGGLMAWDDDLDLSVPEEFTAQTLQLVRKIEKLLPHADALGWVAETVMDSDLERPLGLILSYAETNSMELKKFAVSLWFMFRREGQIRQYINSAPDFFFEGHDSIRFHGRRYRTPRQVDAYLEHHYGNWRQPVQDMSLEEIQNYCPPPPHVRRELLFGSADGG